MSTPQPSTIPSVRADRARIQDLGGAVLAGGETEDLLDLLLHSARTDLAARNALLVMPLTAESWSVELVDGPDAAELLGAEIPPDSATGAALHRADADVL